ncbi:MAG: hypothetical protein K9L86_01660 [Candidatus Omnitrophica bacterium]|nr:hypothetical protein [Candidatus Omnitrophota bacterium]
MKTSFLFIVLFSLLFSFYLLAQDIPEELVEIGFDSSSLIDYRREDDIEHFFFLNWQTDEPWDTIVFVVEKGQVVDWFEQEPDNS